MHPLLDLWLSRPQLLVDHAQAYGALVEEDLVQVRAACRWWALLHAITIACFTTAGVLAGVALMLWAVLAANQMQAPGLLLAIPLLPLAMAVSCLVVARQKQPLLVLATLREQISADMAMLRSASAP